MYQKQVQNKKIAKTEAKLSLKSWPLGLKFRDFFWKREYQNFSPTIYMVPNFNEKTSLYHFFLPKSNISLKKVARGYFEPKGLHRLGPFWLFTYCQAFGFSIASSYNNQSLDLKNTFYHFSYFLPSIPQIHFSLFAAIIGNLYLLQKLEFLISVFLVTSTFDYKTIHRIFDFSRNANLWTLFSRFTPIALNISTTTVRHWLVPAISSKPAPTCAKTCQMVCWHWEPPTKPFSNELTTLYK